MDRLERIVVVVAVVFVMFMVILAQDERDALATKIDEMIGAGQVHVDTADLGSGAHGAWRLWRMPRGQ